VDINNIVMLAILLNLVEYNGFLIYVSFLACLEILAQSKQWQSLW